MRLLLCAVFLLGAFDCGKRVPAPPSNQPGLAVGPCTPWPALPPPAHPADSIRAVFMELDDSLEISIKEQTEFFHDFRMNAVVVHSIVGYDSLTDREPVYRIAQAVHLLSTAPPETAIYIGLAYDSSFVSDELDTAYVRLAIQQDLAAADSLIALAGKYSSRIAGWYLSREIHNFNPAYLDDPRQAQRVHDYLDAVSRALPQRSRVLISPYFVPSVPPRKAELLDPQGTAELFAFLVRGTRVTDVLLQDGTGVRNDPQRQLACKWRDPVDYIRIAAVYADAVSRALPRQEVRFWSNLEGFVRDSDKVADVEGRFAQQLAVVPAERPLIMFDAAQCANVKVCARRH